MLLVCFLYNKNAFESSIIILKDMMLDEQQWKPLTEDGEFFNNAIVNENELRVKYLEMYKRKIVIIE